jgi:peptidyl-prolyl cis-trans isomerase D
MLKIMRENVQSKFIKGMLWAVIFSFVAGIIVIWGKGSSTLEGDTNTVAEVAGISLDRYTFEQKYRMAAQDVTDKQKKMQIVQEVIYSFIREELWLKEAEELGIKATSKELFDFIINYRDMQGNFVFRNEKGIFVGDEIYQAIINRQGISVASFEADIKKRLILSKLQHLLLSGVDVSNQEALEYYRTKNETATIKVGLFSSESFQNKIELKRPDLEKFYNDNKEKFRRPITNKYDVVIIPLSMYESKVSADNNEARRYYDSHIESYFVKEQRQTRHILFKVKEGADNVAEEAARKNAEKAFELAQKGEDFAKLAQKFSEDETTAVNGGLLPYAQPGSMDKAYDEAMLTMKIDEIRGPVKTAFGYHVIKLVGILPAGYRDYIDVKDQVIASLKKAKAEDLRDAALKDIQDKLESSDNWERTANELKLVYSTTAFIVPGAIPEGVPFTQELFTITQEMSVGDVTAPIKSRDDIFFLKLREQRESSIPPMDEVIKDVENNYKDEQVRVLIKKVSEETLEKIKAGAYFDETVISAGGKIESPKAFSRLDSVENIGRLPDLIYRVFGASPSSIGGPVEFYNGYLIYQVLSKADYDFAKFMQNSDQIRQEILTEKEKLALSSNLELISKREKIQINNKLIEELIK